MEPYRLIDAHVHFWDPGVLRYPWLDDEPALRRAFLPTDLDALATRAIDGLVFVEANCLPSQHIAECDFVEQLTAHEPRILGTVAFVDLLDADARRVSLEQLARRERVVGVRHNVQGQPRGFALQPEFVRGVQEVAGHDLTFDLCITAAQLPEITELVRRCPDARFVLDHCGKPSVRSDAFEPWATDLARLAECANAACKLSGLLTEARPDQRGEEVLSRYARHAMLCFGAERLLYGSDWPVVTISGGERAWHELADTITAEWADDDRRAFFGENAVQVYGLDLSTGS